MSLLATRNEGGQWVDARGTGLHRALCPFTVVPMSIATVLVHFRGRVEQGIDCYMRVDATGETMGSEVDGSEPRAFDLESPSLDGTEPGTRGASTSFALPTMLRLSRETIQWLL